MNVVGVPRGNVTGTQVELELPYGEFITAVEGTFSDSAISKIAFTTSSGVYPASNLSIKYLSPLPDQV